MPDASFESLAETTDAPFEGLRETQGPAIAGPVSGSRDDAEEFGLEIVELELALDAAQADNRGFTDTVATAVQSIGGELLFCLPASGLAGGQQKIAAVRIPVAGARSLVFVFLSEDGARLSVRPPDTETAGLASFSRAFVNLLQQL